MKITLSKCISLVIGSNNYYQSCCGYLNKYYIRFYFLYFIKNTSKHKLRDCRQKTCKIICSLRSSVRSRIPRRRQHASSLRTSYQESPWSFWRTEIMLLLYKVSPLSLSPHIPRKNSTSFYMKYKRWCDDKRNSSPIHCWPCVSHKHWCRLPSPPSSCCPPCQCSGSSDN